MNDKKELMNEVFKFYLMTIILSVIMITSIIIAHHVLITKELVSCIVIYAIINLLIYQNLYKDYKRGGE